MKASRAQIDRALDSPSAETRFILLHGPDESQSRELAARLGKRLGPDAERVDLSGAQLKADPARLTDEAAAISLFGGARHIRVEPAGDEVLDAVTALLEAPAAGNPVVMVAGALRKTSALLKRALSHPAVLAFASYPPDAGDMDRLAGAMAHARGLHIDLDIAAMLSSATAGDRSLLAQEIEKLALAVDAEPDRPAPLDRGTFEALSAGTDEGDTAGLIDRLLSGRSAEIVSDLGHLATVGIEGIALVRPLLRRLFLLADLLAEVEGGSSIDTTLARTGGGIFWKDRPAIATQLRRWTGDSVAKAIERLLSVERAVKASGSAGSVLVESELVAIARYAAGR